MGIVRANSNFIADDRGYILMYDSNGVMFTMRTATKALRRYMTVSELFNISQSFGRDVMNQIIIDELNILHDQFFEEV